MPPSLLRENITGSDHCSFITDCPEITFPDTRWVEPSKQQKSRSVRFYPFRFSQQIFKNLKPSQNFINFSGIQSKESAVDDETRDQNEALDTEQTSTSTYRLN